MTPKPYLNDSLKFTDDAIYDTQGKAVMMSWEESWMKDTAEIICQNRGDILNIGHGMGIVDNFIQSHSPNSHTIVEPHIDVLSQMKKNGWFSKPNIKIYQSKWQDCIQKLKQFDGVYFDTWDNDDKFYTNVIPNLHRLLKVGGIFTFWYPRNTPSEKLEEKLDSKYFNLEYKKIKIPLKKPEVVKKEYYMNPHLGEVLLPIITKKKNIKLSII